MPVAGRTEFLLTPLYPCADLSVALLGDLMPVGSHSHKGMMMRSSAIQLRKLQTRDYLLHAEPAALEESAVRHAPEL